MSRPAHRRSSAAQGRAALAPALALAVLAAFGVPAISQYESFSGAASVTLVEVPVTVIHKGRPVEGLGVDDFAVFDRGERQAIESFEVLSVDVSDRGAGTEGQAGRPETVGALAARRNFLFLFDLAYADRRSLSGAASALDRLLADGLAPGDRVGVGFFSALHGYQWVVGLTDRHEEARHALEVMRAVIDSDRGRARRLLDGWEPPPSVAPAGAAVDPEAVVAEAGVSGANRAGAGWPTTSILRSLVRGLTRIADETAGLDGRKHLVHFSYGIPDHQVTGRGSERARVLGLLQEIKHACRAAGWAIDSVNLAGLGFGRDSLLMMASDTGGQLFTNSNDVGVLVREMEETSRLTYLLTFQPSSLEPDGAFHRIEVEVSGLPRGARVVHRPGYYAPD